MMLHSSISFFLSCFCLSIYLAVISWCLFSFYFSPSVFFAVNNWPSPRVISVYSPHLFSLRHLVNHSRHSFNFISSTSYILVSYPLPLRPFSPAFLPPESSPLHHLPTYLPIFSSRLPSLLPPSFSLTHFFPLSPSLTSYPSFLLFHLH